ncbi:MAG: histidine phosphatase family protein, partial [Candidatus Promineofilum sp.]|nr:histidine phosphatase family protein [Promineifilum sp.]
MKTLLLLRHAKSSWEDGNLADFDRSLNARGRSDAPRMGRLLAQYELTPDLIVTSAARRAATTAELIALAAEYAGDIQYTNELYLADPETFLDVARDTADGVARLMLVGHNPGIEELVSNLAGREERMPTAALACFRLAIEHWRELNDETAAELL